MTDQEKKDRILYIKAKSYAQDDEIKDIWTIYESLFGTYHGSKGCQECLREAIKDILNKLD